jgi:hypothetical protein
VANAPAALPPVKIAGIHCTGDCKGPRVGLEGCGKSRHPPGLYLRTVDFVASSYTDGAVPAHGEQTGKVSLPELVSQVLINLMPQLITRRINWCVAVTLMCRLTTHFGTSLTWCSQSAEHLVQSQAQTQSIIHEYIGVQSQSIRYPNSYAHGAQVCSSRGRPNFPHFANGFVTLKNKVHCT